MPRITTTPVRTFSLLVAACLGLVGCDDKKDGGGTPADAATVSDAPVVIDAPKLIDASMSSMGSPTTINCGTDSCDRASEVCCFTGYPNITTECAAPAACTTPKLLGKCDGPEDCAAGEICCGNTMGAQCVAANACTGGAAARLCHTANDCANGQICRPSNFVAWPICANN